MPRWQSEHRPFKCEAPECAAARANPLYAAAAAMYKYDKRGGAPNKKRARASRGGKGANGAATPQCGAPPPASARVVGVWLWVHRLSLAFLGLMIKIHIYICAIYISLCARPYRDPPRRGETLRKNEK